MFIPLSNSTKVMKNRLLLGNRKRPERLYDLSRSTPRSVPLTPPLSPPALKYQNGNTRIKQERVAPCSISLVVHSGEKNSRESFYQDEYIVILAELRGRLGAALGRESGWRSLSTQRITKRNHEFVATQAKHRCRRRAGGNYCNWAKAWGQRSIRLSPRRLRWRECMVIVEGRIRKGVAVIRWSCRRLGISF